jgi:hypothetical protein
MLFTTHLAKFHRATNNEKSSQNEIIMNKNDEIYLNDVLMENDRMEKKYEIQSSPQTINK